ncbi:hypothetical protein D3C87_405360 [compost metagenome]
MKTSLLKVLYTTVFFISIYGCSSNEDNGNSTPGKGGGNSSSISGSYNIISMISDVAVDLNNDGVSSNDLLMETDPEFFNTSIPDLEIKSTIYNNALVPLMNFYLPQPNVTINTPNRPGSVIYSRTGLGYFYDFNNQTQTITIDKSNESPTISSLGRMENVRVTGKNKLEAVFSKYYYDFAVSRWRLLTITCVYTKI